MAPSAALSLAWPLTLVPSVAIAAVLGVSVYVVVCLRDYLRLAHVPGPRWMGLTNLIMAQKSTAGRIQYDMMELSEKYGPIIRVGPNMILVSDPGVLRKMSAVRGGYRRGPFYTLIRITPGVDNVFSMRDDKLHKVLKSKMGPGYSGREMGGFEAGMDKHIASFVSLIERKYLSTPGEYRPMDMAIKCNYFALDVISELGFGAAFGFLREDRDLYQYNEKTRRFFPFVMFISSVPALLSMLGRWPLNTMGPASGDSAGFGRLMRFAGSFVDGRLAPGSKRGKDMMQSFIDRGLTREELRQEVFTETLAGSDTIATAVRSTLLCLLGNSVALATLRKEMDDGIAAGAVSSPIKDSEARQMPYLQAVIREGLRMFPPATGVISKEVPPGGDTILGYDIPGGVQVGQNIVAVLRIKELFGEDAEVFRPERWIEAAAEGLDRYRAMVDVVELVFGTGKYQCLGRTIAQMELNKVFVELLRRFDFTIVNVHKPVRQYGAGIVIMDDFWVRVSKRADAS
ncbi:Putative cytochrome P450 [Tolypocladium paradoxum]|uniref:Cytochrome P450 n=1 Tax=Tolypocladium paradoxum TaxID=94208 RepID=A0A2S4L8Z5_9HYPO|nr:Putative cytochrome P450 [Tolypocladium paradoxum]